MTQRQSHSGTAAAIRRTGPARPREELPPLEDAGSDSELAGGMIARWSAMQHPERALDVVRAVARFPGRTSRQRVEAASLRNPATRSPMSATMFDRLWREALGAFGISDAA